MSFNKPIYANRSSSRGEIPLPGGGGNTSNAFNQILSRTQENLNKINQKYSNNISTNANTSSNRLAGRPSTASFIPSMDNVSNNQNVAASIGNINFSSGNNPMTKQTSINGFPQQQQQQKQPLQQPQQQPIQQQQPPQQPINTNTNKVNQVLIDEQLLVNILERITVLEERNHQYDEMTMKIHSLDKNISSINNKMENIQFDSTEISRNHQVISNKLQLFHTTLDYLQQENESRRHTLMKYEHYLTENEQSKMSMELQLQKLQKEVLKLSTDLSPTLNSNYYCSKLDFEQYKEKTQLYLSTSITNQLQSSQELQNEKIRDCQREIALLKLAQSQAVQVEMNQIIQNNLDSHNNSSSSSSGGSSNILNTELVNRVLNSTALPSELAVKGKLIIKISYKFILYLYLSIHMFIYTSNLFICNICNICDKSITFK